MSATRERDWDRVLVRQRFAEKVQRLLVLGHVHVLEARRGLVKAAVVNGRQASTYLVQLVDGQWSCACRSRHAVCTHVVAVQRVTQPLPKRDAR